MQALALLIRAVQSQGIWGLLGWRMLAGCAGSCFVWQLPGLPGARWVQTATEHGIPMSFALAI